MEEKYTFKNKVRVRACGLLLEDDRILLIKHDGIGKKGYLWSPPGGGVEFGESGENTLIREFLEETGLHVSVERFLFIHEFINPELHAIELFYEVKKISGKLKLGLDPEMSKKNQILSEIGFFSNTEMEAMDHDLLHNAFNCNDHPIDIFNIKGIIKFHNI